MASSAVTPVYFRPYQAYFPECKLVSAKPIDEKQLIVLCISHFRIKRLYPKLFVNKLKI